MNGEKRDRLDQEIDEVLGALASEEPRRVSAASVRRALEVSRPSRLPLWFAAAAVLIVAFGAWMKGRTVAPTAPISVARSTPVPERAQVQPSPSSSVPDAGSSSSAPSRPKSRAVEAVGEPVYEGLPRLVIATIEQPEPLATRPLDGDALVIPPIEIPTLSVPTLSPGPEQQEKPQP